MVVSNWLPPVSTGSSFYAESLARALAARGHEVHAVTLDWDGGFRPDPQPSFAMHMLPVVKLPKLGIFYGMNHMGFAYNPANVARLRELVRRIRPDVIHQVNHIFDTVFLSLAAATPFGIPVVGSITTPIQHQKPALQRALQAADRCSVGAFGVRRWARVVSLDAEVHEYVGRSYGPKVQARSVVIPLAPRFDDSALYDSIEGKPSPTPFILSIGQMHPFRNPVQLVRAMPLLLEEFPDARLMLVGRRDIAEPERAARELELDESRVAMPGELPHRRMLELMKEAHVHASWITGPFRNLGTAHLEAMLCGLPVVSDVPENLYGEGRLKNGENIVIVDQHDLGSIVDGLSRLLRDASLRRRIADGALKLVREELTWRTLVKEMERLYDDVLAERR